MYAATGDELERASAIRLGMSELAARRHERRLQSLERLGPHAVQRGQVLFGPSGQIGDRANAGGVQGAERRAGDAGWERGLIRVRRLGRTSHDIAVKVLVATDARDAILTVVFRGSRENLSPPRVPWRRARPALPWLQRTVCTTRQNSSCHTR